MKNNLRYANVITPIPQMDWQLISDENRLDIIKNKLLLKNSTSNNKLILISAKKDGQVIFKFTEPIGSDKRGTVLLDLEEFLKEAIDPGLTVWLESLGDNSSLRNLRGIEVKS